MNPRTLDSVGAIASILGFSATIAVALLTEYSTAALASLILTELVALGIWLHYTRRRKLLIHPYPREDLLDSVRYVFESPYKMRYEVVEAFRVTCPLMTSFPVTLWWTGAGNILVSSALSPDGVSHTFDSQSGKIEFEIPFAEQKRFGDLVVTHYALELDDVAKTNQPVLNKKVRRPCQLVILECVLSYVEAHAPAVFGWRPSDEGDYCNLSKIHDVPFDTVTKSFRKIISRPILARTYELNWSERTSERDNLDKLSTPSRA